MVSIVWIDERIETPQSDGLDLGIGDMAEIDWMKTLRPT